MTKFLRTERGQALFIMVFVLVGLLAMLGLAIDGGTVFLERRRMQNAADAAALAGARLLAAAICDEETPDVADAAILAEVIRYAEINGVPSGNVVADYVDFDEAVLGHVGDGAIPDGSTGISATVEISRSTHFVTLVGIDTAGASADALAMTGPPLAAGGLRPFGVPLELLQVLDPDDPNNNWFTISFKHDGGDITWAGGHLAQHRGWMNLGYVWNQGEDPDFPRAIDDSANANTLREWMVNGWQGGVLYADCEWASGCRYGDYVHAKPGTNSTAICAAPEDTLIYIPIYDYIPDCETEPIPEPKPDCPTQGGGNCYHIVGFAGVKITDCEQGQGVITADLVNMITGWGQPSPNGGYQSDGGSDACETYTMVVTLWR